MVLYLAAAVVGVVVIVLLVIHLTKSGANNAASGSSTPSTGATTATGPNGTNGLRRHPGGQVGSYPAEQGSDHGSTRRRPAPVGSHRGNA